MKAFVKGAAIALTTIGVNALAAVFNPLLRQAAAIKHATLIKMAYRALNPWIIANTSLGRSELYRAVRRGVEMLSDGQLDPAELDLVTTVILKRFDILKAADGLAPPQKSPLVIEEEMNGAIAVFKDRQRALGVEPYSTSAKDLL